jgi:hypothetical protein
MRPGVDPEESQRKGAGRLFPVILFQSHVVLMAAGSVTVAAAIFIAMMLRQRRLWLRLHRGAGLSGTVLILSGGAAAAAAITVTAGEHLRSPHTWIGALTIAAAVATPIIGFLQFKIRRRVEILRVCHRIGGRILGGAILVTILFGLHTAGFL